MELRQLNGKSKPNSTEKQLTQKLILITSHILHYSLLANSNFMVLMSNH